MKEKKTLSIGLITLFNTGALNFRGQFVISGFCMLLNSMAEMFENNG